MLLNVILALSFAPVWPVLYFITRNNVKPKKNIILGVTLPYQAQNDPETKALCASFLKTLNLVCFPLLPLLVPPFFMEGMGPSMTWFMSWLLLLITLPHLAFAVYRGKLMTLKKARGWHSAAAGRRLADVKAAAVPGAGVHGIWFVLPVLISFFPLFHCLFADSGRENLILYASFAPMTPLFWLFSRLIYRVRSELLNEDLSLTMALTRVRRYHWSRFFLLSAWLTAAANLLIWFFPDSATAFLIIVLGYSAALIVLSVQTELTVRVTQQKLTAGDSGELYLDEDEYWLLGLFYCNPNDKHFLVNDRVGMNMSVNLARPAAKLLMVFSVLCCVSMPFFGLWLWAEEGVPARLVLSESSLTARHTGDEYVIPLDEISSVELINALPSAKRTWGTGLDNLCKGNFSVSGYGAAKLCLQPKDPPFLIVRAGGELYFFNDAEESVTRAVYEALAARS